MKTICANGHTISTADKLAFEHYLLETPKTWATKALSGLINNAIKTIYNDYIEEYKANNTSIPANIADIITGILALETFKAYNKPSPENEAPVGTLSCSIEVWSGGFEIEDYEYSALTSFYADPEQAMYDLMDNKISKRRNVFIKENTPILLDDSTVTTVPTIQDDFISQFVLRVDYKNAVERKAEQEALGV